MARTSTGVFRRGWCAAGRLRRHYIPSKTATGGATTKVYVRVAGAWVEVSNVYVMVGGVWTEVTPGNVNVRVGGAWVAL